MVSAADIGTSATEDIRGVVDGDQFEMIRMCIVICSNLLEYLRRRFAARIDCPILYEPL